jgi:hypothetical protein
MPCMLKPAGAVFFLRDGWCWGERRVRGGLGAAHPLLADCR